MCFRNRDKKGALSGVKEPALLVLKVILDSVSRILLFSAWLYVINAGEFSALYTLCGYYFVFAVLMVFNLVFSSSRDVYTGKYWIGMQRVGTYSLHKNYSFMCIQA